MKKVVALALFFFCVIVFSATPPASADEIYTTTAREASDANMGSDDQEAERAMRDFVLHVKEHRALTRSDDSRAEFRNALRNSNGVWRHRDIYVITVNKSGSGGRAGTSVQAGDIVFFHAKYPAAGSGSLREIQIFRDLVDMVEKADGEAVCIQDRTGEYGNHICAVEDYNTTESGARHSFIQIAGFNHKLEEVDHSKAIDACPDLGSRYFSESGTDSDGESFKRTRADMVDDEESLENFVKTVEEHIAKEFAGVPAGGSGQQSGNDVQGRFPLVEMIQLMPCWRMQPWKSGSIYFFIFTYTDKRFAIFNGHNPASQDTAFHLIDDNNLNIPRAMLAELHKEDNTPGEGFLTYLWDNPVVPGDEVVCKNTGPVSAASPEDEDEQVFFCEEGEPIPGRSPGTSVKHGYFILTDFGIEGDTDYILGSGIYPKSQEGGGEGGGGGCAIASGSGNELEAAAFGLFLITAVLFLAVSVKSRPVEKLLTWDLRARRKDKCR